MTYVYEYLQIFCKACLRGHYTSITVCRKDHFLGLVHNKITNFSSLLCYVFIIFQCKYALDRCVFLVALESFAASCTYDTAF